MIRLNRSRISSSTRSFLLISISIDRDSIELEKFSWALSALEIASDLTQLCSVMRPKWGGLKMIVARLDTFCFLMVLVYKIPKILWPPPVENVSGHRGRFKHWVFPRFVKVLPLFFFLVHWHQFPVLSLVPNARVAVPFFMQLGWKKSKACSKFFNVYQISFKNCPIIDQFSGKTIHEPSIPETVHSRVLNTHQKHQALERFFSTSIENSLLSCNSFN